MPANIEDLPDYISFEYDEPVYEAHSYSTNLAEYRTWRNLWARRHFHEACEDWDSSQPDLTTDSIILRLPYHPDFPEVFIQHLTAISEDGLSLADVQHFLETNYGSSLEKPDCDYLSNLISSIPDPGHFPNNKIRALQWLVDKKAELPLWPPQFSKQGTTLQKYRIYTTSHINSAKNKYDDTVNNLSAAMPAQVNKRPRPLQNSAPVLLDENPFKALLLEGFSFALLTQLLHKLDLINDNGIATGKAKPGALAGVVFALRYKNCIMQTPEAIRRALTEEFKVTLSSRSLQGAYNPRNKSSKYFYDKTIDYIKEHILKK